MAFRADETAQNNFQSALSYLTPRGVSEDTRRNIKSQFEEIVSECGPVVDGYPAWHPFLSEADPQDYAPTTPLALPSFNQTDHNVYMVNGFITCPYKERVDKIFEGVEALELTHNHARITVEKIQGEAMYNEGAVPILIRCRWGVLMEDDGTIPLRTALGLMLEREIPSWRWSTHNESWEDMRGQILGYPHGARSSLFINQTAGQQLKSVWMQLTKSGLWGSRYK